MVISKKINENRQDIAIDSLVLPLVARVCRIPLDKSAQEFDVPGARSR